MSPPLPVSAGYEQYDIMDVSMQWRRQGGCFGCLSTPFMPEPIGLVYCTVRQVYILPEDSADSEHPVYLRIPLY